MSIKVAQKDFTRKIKDFDTITKMLPQALKSCPKSYKSPILVTLVVVYLAPTGLNFLNGTCSYVRDISRGIISRQKSGRVEIEIGEASPTF